MTNRDIPRATGQFAAEPKGKQVTSGYGIAILRVVLWSVLALGLTASVHFANIVTLQGFQLGFYFAAQGIPIALVVMAFWWTRRAGFERAGLLPPGSQGAGAIEAAAVLVSPAVVILVVGELLQTGYDGLSTTLGIAAGLVLAILLFSGAGWTGARQVLDARAKPPEVAGEAADGNRPAGVIAALLAVCLVPLIAAHLVLALDLTRSLLPDYGQERLLLLVGLSLGVVIIAALPVAGLASALLIAAFLALAVSAVTLAGALALHMPDNPLPIPQISYGLALDQIKALERALILDGLADPAAMHQHSRPFTSWSELNFSAFLLCAIFGTAALAGVMMLAANRAATANAAYRVHAPTSPQQGGLPSAHPSPAPRAFLTARALAWAGFLVLVVTITLPAISAFTKLEIFRSVAGGIAIETQPDWLRYSQSAGAVDLCPASANEPSPEQTDTDGFGFTTEGEPPVGELPIGEPRQSDQPEGPPGGPVEADLAASSDTQSCVGPAPRLAIDDIAIKTERAAIVSASVAGAGPGWLDGIAAAIVAAVLAGAVGLTRLAAGGIAGLRQPSRLDGTAGAIATLAIVSAAAVLAVTWASPAIDLAKIALALLAAILFPALAVMALRPSASTLAILIAALTGAALAGYYIIATSYAPQDFAMQWQALSSAPEWKYEELIRLMDACQDGDRISCASASEFAGELANWWGLKTSAGGILGLPAGLFVGLLAASILPARK